jgi:hypothetical protein
VGRKFSLHVEFEQDRIEKQECALCLFLLLAVCSQAPTPEEWGLLLYLLVVCYVCVRAAVEEEVEMDG